MTNKLNQIVKAHFESPLVIGLTSLFLVACGGGGGGTAPASSDKANNQSVSYTPDAERLLESAESSEDLYVEEDFAFGHTQLTQLRLLINNDEGDALSHARVKVYLIDTQNLETLPGEWNDELLDHAQLMSGGLSDASGEFVRVLELPNHQGTPMLMVEVNAMGIENKKLVMAESHYTSLTFGQL